MTKMTCAPGPAVGMSAPCISLSRISILGIFAVCVSAISVIGISVAAWPGRALAQADGKALDTSFDDMTWPVTGSSTSPVAGPLPPAEIMAEVRREGFYPVSRPVHRGRVYVLFAVDQDDMDVKLTVDATSGRVLWVAGAVARIGGPGHYGSRSHWHAEFSPVPPPSEVPNNTASTVRNMRPTGGGTSHGSLRRFPPLPRTRPVDLAGGGAPPAAPAAVVPVTPPE